VVDYTLVKGLHPRVVSFPGLELKDDRSFVSTLIDTTIEGTWSADDDGDHTYITLTTEDEESWGLIYGTEETPRMDISMPGNIAAHYFGELQFEHSGKSEK